MSHKEYPKYGGLERNFKGKAMTEPKTQAERAKAIKRFHEECLMPSELYDLGFEAATRGLREQLEAAEAVIRHYGDNSNWGHHLSGVDGQGKRQYVAVCYEATRRSNGYDLAQEYLKKHLAFPNEPESSDNS